LPSCTKFLFSNAVILSLSLNLFSYNPVINELDKYWLWRYYTSFFLLPLSISGALHLYFLYLFSMEIETSKFSGRPADYVYYLLFVALTLTIQNYTWPIVLSRQSYMVPIILSHSLMMAITYTWSLHNKRTNINIFHHVKFKAGYLPFILVVFDTFLTHCIPFDLIAGIIAGHLYFYLKERSRTRLLSTPGWLIGLFPYTRRTYPPSRNEIDFKFLGFMGWDFFGLMSTYIRDRRYGYRTLRNDRWRGC